VTTLAVNMALALAGEAGRSVVLAELHPGPGVAASRLGITAPDRLADLALQVRDDYLPPDLAEQALSAPVHGVQLLAAPSVPLTDDQPGPDAAESIARALAGLAACVVIDLGSGQNRRIRAVARIAHRVVLVAEPLRPSMRRADQALHDLTGSGVEPPRVSVALAYRHPSLRHADPGVVSAGLGIDHVCVLPADPDRAAEALARGLPLLLLDPGGPPAQEMHRLGAEISRRLDLS
jgi:Flp pilus assembly CpaE family ATPase